ncbi:MAG: hypothetical protein QXO43_08280 [Metallosphaera sp.]
MIAMLHSLQIDKSQYLIIATFTQGQNAMKETKGSFGALTGT